MQEREVMILEHVGTPELAGRLESLKSRLSDLGLNQESLEDLQRLIGRSKVQEFRLVVVGGFSRGKSTLINAMFNEQILSAGLEPTTGLVIELMGGDECRFELLGKNGEVVQSHEKITDIVVLRKLLTEFSVQKNLDKEHNYSKIKVVLPGCGIPEGLVIVDTPGIGSVLGHHDRITEEEVKNADGVLFVTAVDPIIDGLELSFYRIHVQSGAMAKTLCILTKADYVKDKPRELKTVVEYVKEHTALNDEQIIKFSAKNRDLNGIEHVWEGVKTQLVQEGPYKEKANRLRRDLDRFKENVLAEILIQKGRSSNFTNVELDKLIEGQSNRLDQLELELANQVKESSNFVSSQCETGKTHVAKALKKCKSSIKSAKGMDALAKAVTVFSKAIGERLSADVKAIEEHVRKFECACETERYKLNGELQASMSIEPKGDWKYLKAGVLGAGAAAAVGAAGMALFPPTTVVTTTLFGSTALASAATWVGLGGLATTTFVTSSVVVPVVATAVAVGGVVALCKLGSQSAAEAKELAKGKHKSIEVVDKIFKMVESRYTDLSKEQIKLIELAGKDIIRREKKRLDILRGRSRVLCTKFKAEEKQRLDSIESILAACSPESLFDT